MTCVRRAPGRSRLTFITEPRKESAKARLRNKHPGEGSGGVGSPPVGLGHLSLLAPERKAIAPRSAAALRVLADVSRRRVHSEVNSDMQPDTSGVSTPQTATNSASTDKDDVSMEELNAKLETFRDGLQSAWEAIDDLEEQLQAEREERRRLEDENEELREEIERLDSRTDLLSLVENSDEMTAKQRRIALIQHLKKAAERERERGREAKASVNKDEAEAALQYPDISRPMFYDDLREAPKLIDNKDVLWYESKSGGESRLKLNLEKGDLPGSIRGSDTEAGGR